LIIKAKGKGQYKRHICQCDRCGAEFTIRDDTLRRPVSQVYKPGERCRRCQRYRDMTCSQCGNEYHGHVQSIRCPDCKTANAREAARIKGQEARHKAQVNRAMRPRPWDPDKQITGPGVYDPGSRHAGIDTNSTLFAPLG